MPSPSGPIVNTNSPMPSSPARARILRFAKILLTLVLLFLVYRKIDFSALGSQFSNLQTGWPWALLFLVLLALNTFISSTKWHALLRADGIVVPVPKLFASHLIGSFFNLFLPSSVGGDIYRIADISRRSGRTANTTASILFDRLTGFMAIALYGIVFYFLASQQGWIHPLLPDCLGGTVSGEARLRGLLYAFLPIAAFLALLGVLLLLLQECLIRAFLPIFPKKLRPKLEAFAMGIVSSSRTYLRQPRAWIPAILISFWFQANAILAVYAISRALVLSLPLFPFWFFVPFITLLEMIPISVFGLGLRDFGYKAFFLSVGLSAHVTTLSTEPEATAAAAALTVLYVALTVLYVSFGGILYLRRTLKA